MSLINCKACGETHDQDRTCARPPLVGRTGSATSFLASMLAQKTFDALVALRLERDGETRESAIAWAKEQFGRPSPNSGMSDSQSQYPVGIAPPKTEESQSAS